MALLGFVTGIVTAAVILGFRTVVDAGLIWLPGDSTENFEGLDTVTRAILIMSGAVVLGLLLNRYKSSARRVGVVHVMERLSLHQGNLPLKNAVIQFIGGAIALVTGQSGGREGPAIHLGATAASLLGRASRLPNNSLRTMVACGTAAAIASSFNTPIAGVIFAMEVVMMEYTIASFIPVIVAAVTSTLITQFVYGNEPAFIVAPSTMHSLFEIPYLVLGGILIGCIAAGYIQLIQAFARLSEQPLWQRIVMAGAITATVAVFVPQVMGVGYDTVNQLMVSEVSIVVLLLILLAKVVTSAAAVGLGMPIGLIGPSLFIGAILGSLFGSLLISWEVADVSLGLYVMLGMCAMMAAVLQAPLAALMAVMELTANTNIILPAMVIIVVATMVTSQVFRQRSVFITTLNTLGLQYPPNPVTLHLQRVGVTAIMDRSFVRLPSQISVSEAEETLAKKPHWIIVEDKDALPTAVLNPSDLAAFVELRQTRESEQLELIEDQADEKIRLLQIPGQRMDVTTIGAEATVMQLQELLDKTQSEACCVTRTTAPMIKPIIGVVTRSHIENYRNTSA
ncbi:MAG: chloride channel protein [Pseudomonadales bacterium]|nr:chloride channel protein [Pseudomonadales bacterium]